MVKNKKSKGGESKHKYFYVVRQSPPTSTPLSQPNSRISLSKPPKALSSLQLTFNVSINLYNQEIISQSLHSSVSHTYTLTNLIRK